MSLIGSESSVDIKGKGNPTKNAFKCFCRCLWPTSTFNKILLFLTVNFVVVSVVILTFCYRLNLKASAISHVQYTETCYETVEFRNDLHNLTYRVRDIVQSLNLKHFLCYDSLWGQIHYRSNLPWENSVQLCLIDDEVEEVDSFSDAFPKQGLDVSYDWNEGLYNVMDQKFQGGQVQLVLFMTDPKSQWFRRIGFKRFRLFPDCREPFLHCFHQYLIEGTLPLLPFGNGTLPVPRRNVAIQKHHYLGKKYKTMFYNVQPLNC